MRGTNPANSQARTATSWQGLPGYGPIHGSFARSATATWPWSASRWPTGSTASNGSEYLSVYKRQCRSSTIGTLASPSASWTLTRMPGAVRASSVRAGASTRPMPVANAATVTVPATPAL